MNWGSCKPTTERSDRTITTSRYRRRKRQMHSGAFLLETAIFAALENHSVANVLIPTMAGFDARSKAASKQRCCNAAIRRLFPPV